MVVTPEPDPTHRARLLDRARRHRQRAAELEQAAGSGTGARWLAVLHGNWTQIHHTARSQLDEGDARTRAGHRIVLAVTAALLGDLPAARRAAAEAETCDAADAFVTRGAGLARSITHLLAGEAGAAFLILNQLAHSAETTGPYAGVGLLAETAYRAGRSEDVAAVLPSLDTPCTSDVRDELAVAHAFVSGDSPSGTSVRSPFALGRIELALGMRRRRARDELSARAHLAAAVDLFRAAGASPWTAMASNELRASGHRVARSPDDLTARQLAVAGLAAAGFTNQQIADRLVLSTRTVGTHLYRTFPKLGITSRHQLPSALSARVRDAGWRATDLGSDPGRRGSSGDDA